MPELSLIKHFRRHAPTHPWVLVGPGQDCAVLKWPGNRELAYKIDQIVEGTHFLLRGKGAATPREIGWKAVAKACSDIAAAGCWPVAATVAVNLPAGSSDKLALGLYQGITACCRKYNFALAGGDICAAKGPLGITVSLLGECAPGRAWTRAGAKPGDVLFVTGTLGGSRARKHLTFAPRLPEARAIQRAIPGGVRACIDITDGLSRDLYHLCEESRCCALLFEENLPASAAALRTASVSPASAADSRARRPRYGARGRGVLDQILRDGEDFELLLAVAPQAAAKLERTWKKARLGTPLTHIGEIRAARTGVRLLRSSGKLETLANVGYEHRP